MGVTVFVELQSRKKDASHASIICISHYRPGRVFEQTFAENTMILFGCSPKFCISIVHVFSWDHLKTLEKLETTLMKNLGEQPKSIMVFSEVAYWRSFGGSNSSIKTKSPYASVLIWNLRNQDWDWIIVTSAIFKTQCYAQYGMRNANPGNHLNWHSMWIAASFR